VSVLGGYDMEEKAARAYDLAALKYWGPSTHINFPVIPHLDFCYLDSHGNFVAVTVLCLLLISLKQRLLNVFFQEKTWPKCGALIGQ